MRIFLVDNYDSFTYNLVHYMESFDVEVEVVRNDKVSMEEIDKFDKIVLSPGPGLPKNAGLMNQVIEKYYKIKPILGVCLGHQALAEFFGAELYLMEEIFHGMSSTINIKDHYIFKGLKRTIEVGRYHSWAVKNIPTTIQPIAYTQKHELMGFQHIEYPSVGLQFHPESIMTPDGLNIIENWLFNNT